jgi:16S rRNA (cytosine967-C5)-methyltransferase
VKTIPSRSVALEALRRIDEGAYANLVLPGLLERSSLSGRDSRFVTELVYGTTRMRRACDFLYQPFLRGDIEPSVRRLLRLGTYQLRFMGTAHHAAVSATVDAAPERVRGLVNAVLRKVAVAPEPAWPDPATELSYPDWVVRRLEADLGREEARLALEWMNRPPEVSERPDGYIQDRASQWVAAYCSPAPGQDILDLCAAPGGKATAMAGSGARLVVAADKSPSRSGLVRSNVGRLGLGNVATVAADGLVPPFPAGSFHAVLVDAPCSGLGVLRRRPDARWRLDSGGPGRLGALQQQLLAAAAPLVGPGGRLFYSVCTLTRTETGAVDEWASAHLDDFEALPGPGGPWRPVGRGSLLLPQDADTDGMYLLGLVRARR